MSGLCLRPRASTAISRCPGIHGPCCCRRTTSTWCATSVSSAPALTVVLVAAAVTGQWLLSAVAVAATAVYAVPHAIFHFLHLEGFPTSDAVAQPTRDRAPAGGDCSRRLRFRGATEAVQPDPERHCQAGLHGLSDHDQAEAPDHHLARH